MLIASVPRRAPLAPALVDGRQFVTCPTPGCGCYPLRADKVRRHLERCPKLMEQKALAGLGFWSAGINLGEDDNEPPMRAPGRPIDDVEFARRIARVFFVI